MLMLTCLNALLVLQLYVTLSLLVRAGGDDPNVLREVGASRFGGSKAGFIALLSLLSLVPLGFFGLVLSLWAFHVYIILRNQTTFEWIMQGRKKQDELRHKQEAKERVGTHTHTHRRAEQDSRTSSGSDLSPAEAVVGREATLTRHLCSFSFFSLYVCRPLVRVNLRRASSRLRRSGCALVRRTRSVARRSSGVLRAWRPLWAL